MPLSKGEEKLKFILNNIQAHVYWKEKETGVYLGCNDQQAFALGYSSGDDIIGKTDFDLPWGLQKASQLREADAYVISTQETLEVEEVVVLDSKSYTFLSRKTPFTLPDSKEVIGVLGVSVDITKLKEVQKSLKEAKEQAEEASSIKSQFIANMSHDLRTPLTGIAGMLDEAIALIGDAHDENVEGAFLELVKKMHNCLILSKISLNELMNLFHGILETMQAEKGTKESEAQVFDIHALIEQHIMLLRAVAGQKQLDLSYDITDAVPQHIFGIQPYLERILTNLLSNALKFTEQGYVKLLVDLVEKPPASVQLPKNHPLVLLLCVKDTGIGIPEDKIHLIFEQFFRLNTSYEGRYKGSGLGLYALKCYVEKMGGKIEVESVVGQGSSFSLYLPFSKAEKIHKKAFRFHNLNSISPQEFLSLEEKIALESSHHSGNFQRRVLIVEDNIIVSKVIQACLKRLKYSFDIAFTASEAVDKAGSTDYDIILMDVGLPDFDGIEAVRRIRRFSDQRKARVPIIALTGHAQEAEKRKSCLDVGMNDVFAKPINQSLLASILERVLSC